MSLPGVNIVEVPPSGAFPQGIASGIAGLVGKFQSGDANTLYRVSSYAQAASSLGALAMGSAMYDVAQFFATGGRTLYIVRVEGTAASILLGAAGAPTATAKVDGTHANYAAGPPKVGCQVVVADGTIESTKKITVQYHYPQANEDEYDTYEEVFDNLTGAAGARPFTTIVNAGSKVINLSAGNETFVNGTYSLAGGVEPDYYGDGTPVGLDLFEQAGNVELVWVDTDASGVRSHLIDMVTTLGYGMAIPTLGFALTDEEAAAISEALDTDRITTPWPELLVYDPVAEVSRPMRAAATRAGILARIYPYLSPSNEALPASVTGLELSLSDAQLVTLQDARISPDYWWGNRGIRVRNGITGSSDANLKQVYRRRMTDYVVRLLDATLQPFVSKPVSPARLAAIRAALHNAFNDLLNRKPEGWIEGFTFVCDGSNNDDETKAANQFVIDGRVDLWNAGDTITVYAEVGENVVVTTS